MLFEFGFIHSVVSSSVSHLASGCLLISVLCRSCDVICFVAEKFKKTVFVTHPPILRLQGLPNFKYCPQIIV